MFLVDVDDVLANGDGVLVSVSNRSEDVDELLADAADFWRVWMGF